jgi:hypothetical protein
MASGWQFNAIFEGSVLKLHQDDRLDITVIQETAGSNAASDYVISVLEELPDEKNGSPGELSKEVSNEKWQAVESSGTGRRLARNQRPCRGSIGIGTGSAVVRERR